MSISSAAVDSLIEMGFPKNQAEKAVIKTGNQGAQLAMDWLFEHQNDPDIDEPVAQGNTLADSDPAPMEEGTGAAEAASSLKCNECGKLLKSEQDAMAHAARTQHADFSESTEEIKPMTAEQKAERVAAMQQKMVDRRREREQQEAKDAIEREKRRRADGKNNAAHREEMETKRKLKEIEKRKREKAEDAKAKQRVREQIARDKAERAARKNPSAAALAPAPAPTRVAAPAPATAQYDTARIQVRLSDGSAVQNTFAPDDTIAVVHHWVESQSDGRPFALMTNFPKKRYTGVDLGITLKEAGLVPAGQLIVTSP